MISYFRSWHLWKEEKKRSPWQYWILYLSFYFWLSQSCELEAGRTSYQEEKKRKPKGNHLAVAEVYFVVLFWGVIRENFYCILYRIICIRRTLYANTNACKTWFLFSRVKAAGYLLLWGHAPNVHNLDRTIYFLSSDFNNFVHACMLSCFICSVAAWLFATPWTVARQAPLSMGFSKQEYWSGLPFPEYYLLNTYYVLDNLPRAPVILLLNDPFRPSSLLLFLTHT